jgi:hypothetical protein
MEAFILQPSLFSCGCGLNEVNTGLVFDLVGAKQ